MIRNPFKRQEPAPRSDEVSILVPAYQAEGFIDRTLYLARGQTHRRCRILVAVDESTDGTVQIARRHARDDARVSVHAHRQRKGWAGNVNSLLARVETPYYFIYFHDDVLLPQYTETLLHALAGRPDAASVHCDMGHFGGGDHVSHACTYDGTGVERLLTFFLSPERGSPLRSLIRRDAAPDLRLPENAVAGLWANEPFLLRLLSAGPALAVPQSLYLRWDKRTGSLTDGWRGLSGEEVLAGHRANLGTMFEIIDGVAEEDEDVRALTVALFLAFVPHLRDLEDGMAAAFIAEPAGLHPPFADLVPAIPAERYGETFAAWADNRWRRVKGDAQKMRPVAAGQA